MKKLICSILFFVPLFLYSQLGVSLHQSIGPFMGVNYEIADRIRPELRIGTNHHFRETYFLTQVSYDVFKKEQYEVYAGLGTFVLDQFNGYDTEYRLIIPVGINIYPLENKNFGFHMELYPLLGDGENFLLGSWGIRYRFNSND